MVSLRHFTQADAAALREAWQSGLPLEEIQAMIDAWNRLEAHGKYFEMFAVVEDGTLAGEVSLYQHSASAVELGPEIFPAFRRRGLGGEAMRLALDAARSKGYKIAAQQVRSDNQASVALHQSLGFETDGYPYINQKGHEVLIFLKAL